MTNVLTAYIAKFSLQEVVEAVVRGCRLRGAAGRTATRVAASTRQIALLLCLQADEAGINAEEAMMGWLKQHFDGGQLEAVPASGGGGLQVVAQHSEAALGADVCLRQAPVAFMPRAARGLFTTARIVRVDHSTPNPPDSAARRPCLAAAGCRRSSPQPGWTPRRMRCG